MRNFIKTVFATTVLIFAVSASASAQTVAVYTSLGVPTGVDTSFKTYMDWRCVIDKTSPQYKYIHNYAWTDVNGFMRSNADRDAGIDEDYYLIALGSYYGTTIGTKYRITTTAGKIFYGVLGDQKSDKHTNSTRQYAQNRDVVEFIVNTRSLHKTVKKMGSAGVFEPLRGSIASIERIDFVDIPDPEPEPIAEVTIEEPEPVETMWNLYRQQRWLSCLDSDEKGENVWKQSEKVRLSTNWITTKSFQ